MVTQTVPSEEASVGLAPTLKVQELADLLRVHPETVRRRIRKGEIYAIEIGDLQRIPRQEVERLLGGLPSLTTLSIEEKQRLIAEQQLFD